MMNSYTIIWSKAFYLIALHVMGIIGIWYGMFHASMSVNALAVVVYVIYGLSITVGMHRYFTHRALELHPAVVILSVVLFSGTGQGTAHDWVRRHLQHHAKEDISYQDPHTPVDGFWHAHMLHIVRDWTGKWLPIYAKSLEGDDIRRRTISWQLQHHWWLAPIMMFGMPLLLGGLADDWLGGLLVIGFARILVMSHSIWSVNSIGHTYGWKVKADSHATNYGNLFRIPIFAVFTLGEAWHANHHDKPRSWKFGRVWKQIDPGAYIIRCLFWLQLARSPIAASEPVVRQVT